ncbi:hypothetical protein [Rhodoflexus sp.]
MEITKFNIDYFRESANGDDKFMKYILNLTARELQQYFDQFAAAVRSGDRLQITRARHKLAPHLEALQAHEMEELVRELSKGSEDPPIELLHAFQQKAALLCSAIQQVANDEN